MWLQFWVPLLVTAVGTHCVCVFCKNLRASGTSTRTFHAPCPRRHDEQTPNTSRRAKSNEAARASGGLARSFGRCSTWRAAMHWFCALSLHLGFAATDTRSRNWHNYLRIKTSLGRAPIAKIRFAHRETARQRLALERTGPRRIAA